MFLKCFHTLLNVQFIKIDSVNDNMKFKEAGVCLCVEQKMQDMDERRIRRLAEGYCQFSDIEKKVLPIISKCLEGISAAGVKIDEKQVNVRCLLA